MLTQDRLSGLDLCTVSKCLSTAVRRRDVHGYCKSDPHILFYPIITIIIIIKMSTITDILS